jgi:hypothetical protein
MYEDEIPLYFLPKKYHYFLSVDILKVEKKGGVGLITQFPFPCAT